MWKELTLIIEQNTNLMFFNLSLTPETVQRTERCVPPIACFGVQNWRKNSVPALYESFKENRKTIRMFKTEFNLQNEVIKFGLFKIIQLGRVFPKMFKKMEQIEFPRS